MFICRNAEGCIVKERLGTLGLKQASSVYNHRIKNQLKI